MVYALNLASDDATVDGFDLVLGEQMWRGYFKFPIVASSDIQGAKVYFYVRTVTGTPPTTHFYNCSNDWIESDDADTVLVPLPCTHIGSQNITFTTMGWKSFDVTTQVKDAYNKGDKNFSIAMNVSAFYSDIQISDGGNGKFVTVGNTTGGGATDNHYFINSSEADTGQPYLFISEQNINKCTDILFPGTYTLPQDIIDSSTSKCMNIQATNVTLDCQGHTIDGDDNANFGIYVNKTSLSANTNIKIKNCKLTDWKGAAIYFQNTGYNTFENLTISSNPDYGIEFKDAYWTNLTNLTVSSNHIGLYFSNASSNLLTYSEIKNNSGSGIYISGGTENSIYNNFFNNTVNFNITGTPYKNNWNTTKQTGTRIFSPGTEIGGNWYSNLNGSSYSRDCTDLDGDGFCDNSLILATYNIDYLPLSDDYGKDFLPPVIEFINPTPENDTGQTSTTIYINTTVWDIRSNISSCILTWKQGTNTAVNYSMTKHNNTAGDATNVTCNYTFTGLADDRYTYKVLANDTNNNFNYTNMREVYVDATPPNITLIYPTNATMNTTTLHNMTANITDTLGIKNATLNVWNTTHEINRTTTTFNKGVTYKILGTIYEFLYDGVFHWFYTAYDWANNLFTSENYTITIDTTPPSIVYSGLTEGNDTVKGTNYIIIEVTASDDTTDIVNYTFTLVNKSGTGYTELNKTTTTEASLNFTNLADYVYLYNVSVIDNLTNKNTTLRRTITISSSTPTITYISPTPSDGDYVNQNYVTINVSVTDDAGISTCLVDWQAVNYTMTKTGTGTSVTCNYTFSSLSGGSYNYKVYANDTTNNWAKTGTRTVIVDTDLPIVFFTTNTPLNNTNQSSTSLLMNVTISDVSPANITYVIVQSSEVNRTTKITTNPGNYSFNFTNLADGITYFNATGTDKAGNKNFTLTRFILIDSTGPNITYSWDKNLYVEENKATDFNITFNYTDAFTVMDYCKYNITRNRDLSVFKANTEFSCSGYITKIFTDKLTFTQSIKETYTITLEANDTLGNTRLIRETFTVDITGGPSGKSNGKSNGKKEGEIPPIKPKAFCGDGICQPSENPWNCKADCAIPLNLDTLLLNCILGKKPCIWSLGWFLTMAFFALMLLFAIGLYYFEFKKKKKFKFSPKLNKHKIKWTN